MCAFENECRTNECLFQLGTSALRQKGYMYSKLKMMGGMISRRLCSEIHIFIVILVICSPLFLGENAADVLK